MNFQLTPTRQQYLLRFARESIAHGLRTGKPLICSTNEDKLLQEQAASFVTLTLNGALRGCIGSLEAHRPLAEDVCANAFAAAFRDPRFPALTPDEFNLVHIEISVLTPLEEMVFASEKDLLDQIIPFEDGLVLEDRGRRGTFLPLVWKQLPDKTDFLSHLKQKAGLPSTYWSDTLRCYRYKTLVFEESAL